MTVISLPMLKWLRWLGFQCVSPTSSWNAASSASRISAIWWATATWGLPLALPSDLSS